MAGDGENANKEAAAMATKVKKQLDGHDSLVKKRCTQLDKIDGQSKKALKSAAEIDELMND